MQLLLFAHIEILLSPVFTSMSGITRSIFTFCVTRRRCKIYCGRVHLFVCLWVCLSVRGLTPTLLHGPGCNLGHGRGCPIVVHYWVDLQSVHGLRCYGKITLTIVTSLRPSRDMTT